jgi:hypothetical protein
MVMFCLLPLIKIAIYDLISKEVRQGAGKEISICEKMRKRLGLKFTRYTLQKAEYAINGDDLLIGFFVLKVQFEHSSAQGGESVSTSIEPWDIDCIVVAL